MKAILISLFLFATVSGYSQTYEDSTITLQFTQRFAWWIAKGFKDNFNADKANEYFQLRTALKKAVGSGDNPDSVFTAAVKAGYVKNAIELLLSRQVIVAIDDYNSIVLNSPAIPGYTALQNQIVAKANGNSSEKQVATWLRDWYLERKAQLTALYNEEKQRVILWAN